jgi:FtsH-binding integral membrane protein
MDSVFDSKGRKARRMQSEIGGRISENLYNLIMGGVILYGLLVNVIMCRFFPVEQFLASISPLVFFIGYIVLVIVGTMISAKSDNPFVSFLGYNLIVFPLGIVVSEAVVAYGGMDSAVVGQAFLYTAIITLVMVCAASAFPGFFSKIGGVLFAALIGLIIKKSSQAERRIPPPLQAAGGMHPCI